MQLRAICSEALSAKSAHIYRVLLTVLTPKNLHPQYIMINLIDPPHELEQGKIYRVIIEEE